jgi:L-threonylcarbamoyladenylate synthase
MISEILKTVEYLKDGGIIIYPSDTIWAIGCDATNSKAINKIFKIKKRDSSSPLICLMNDYQMLNKYVNLTKKNKDFLELQKKPTTIIFTYYVLNELNIINSNVRKSNKDHSILKSVLCIFCVQNSEFSIYNKYLEVSL